MSGSTKKKLRKESVSAALTEKQKREQAEARKLKATTISFVAVILAIVLVAASVLSIRAVNQSGIIDRNTIAAVTGNHELDSIQMNYYLVDYVRTMHTQWSSSYGSSMDAYMSIMGLDMNKPMDEQKYPMEEGKTWADYFLQGALDQAKNTLALYDKATAENFKLTETEQQSLDYNIQLIELYALYGGFKNANKYLQTLYGYGADMDSYKEYAKITAIASAYYNQHSESLTYNDAAIREYEKDKYNEYSSFDYSVYNVLSSTYLKGGTTNENKVTTYTDEEKEAARKAAEDVANKLAESAGLTALNEAIKQLKENEGKENASCTTYTSTMYSNIAEAYRQWISSSDRKADDIAVFANETTLKDNDGKETKTINGYYVVCFNSRNDNLRPLANVRHLLVKFEGGTTDSKGNTTYSDKEKDAAKAEAERLLQEWKDGKATEDSFIELVKKHSDDSSKDTGGLFEDIHPASSYVESFRNWSLDEARKPGDTGVIASEYGYHVMYYSSDDELTYRDFMISEDLRAADMEKWYTEITKPVSITAGKTNRLNLDLIINNVVS